MTRKLYYRLTLLVSLLVLLVCSTSLGPSATSSARICPVPCARDCRNQYTACLNSGLLGCDVVYAQCLEQCGCPPGGTR